MGIYQTEDTLQLPALMEVRRVARALCAVLLQRLLLPVSGCLWSIWVEDPAAPEDLFPVCSCF